ncbi:hypothetical protein BC628DRAFT_335337 [Trametes gibbosa]|nr:hypothetical protein BC628DRAFT_335337 [Trametes gibbosa]
MVARREAGGGAAQVVWAQAGCHVGRRSFRMNFPYSDALPAVCGRCALPAATACPVPDNVNCPSMRAAQIALCPVVLRAFYVAILIVCVTFCRPTREVRYAPPPRGRRVCAPGARPTCCFSSNQLDPTCLVRPAVQCPPSYSSHSAPKIGLNGL